MSSGTAAQNGAAPQALEREVERNREDLARTVDALHHKLDLVAQARQRATRLRSAATTPSGAPRPELLATVGAAVALAVLLLRRRHR